MTLEQFALLQKATWMLDNAAFIETTLRQLGAFDAAAKANDTTCHIEQTIRMLVQQQLRAAPPDAFDWSERE